MSAPRRPSVPKPGSRAGTRPAAARSAPATRPTPQQTAGTAPRPAAASSSKPSKPAKSAKSAKPAKPAKPSGRATKPSGRRTKRATAPRPPQQPGRLRGYLPETITTRTLVLSVVVLLVFVLLVPTAREYAKQTAQLDGLRAELTQAQQQREEGTANLKRWDDPAFIQAQARARLGYVKPGETAYRVIDPGVATDGLSAVTGQAVRPGVVPAVPGDTGTWYEKAWTSVQVAGSGVTKP